MQVRQPKHPGGRDGLKIFKNNVMYAAYKGTTPKPKASRQATQAADETNTEKP